MVYKKKSIKFGTDGWRGVIGVDYTVENLNRVVEAVVSYLYKRVENPTIVLGYDCRFNGKIFAEYVATRFSARNVKVLLSPSFVSTPMVSLATLGKKADLGIILTASHNPPEYSGFKIKGSYGGPAFAEVVAEIESLIPESGSFDDEDIEKYISQEKIEYYDAEALYVNHLKSVFSLAEMRRANITIAYDAMYGAGRKVFARLFPEARLLHCEDNPGFNGRSPEPIEKNLSELRELCQKEKILFGLATDGDADRIGLYDDRGVFIDSHHIMLMVAHYLLHYKGMTGKIVSTFSCTDKMNLFAKKNNLPFQTTKIGFKYIAEIMARETVLVGGEESGGIAVAGHIPERDGIYIGLLILEMMTKTQKKISEIIEEIYREVGPFYVERVDLHLSEQEKHRILSECPKYRQFGDFKVADIENLDGYKFRFMQEGWVMIRPSGTEPLLRIYAEACNRDAALQILNATQQTILKD
ncbi:MAG: phosphoglucomutase/phosphomannomutase family protein [Bacteroidia bacterium]|nr:phosphoglucomutase/phosphomannomutase family protein [Bacteroidia bacterium]